MSILSSYPTSEAEEIDEALNTLELAIRLETGYRAGFISDDCYQRLIEVNKDTHSIFNNEYFHNKKPILNFRFKNLVLSQIGVAACALDRALDKKFKDKNPDDHSEIGSIRCIVYMIRNAFAHDPCNPTWSCKEKYLKAPYTVAIDKFLSQRILFGPNVPQVITYEFDFSKMNGKSLNFSDFNALDGFFLLAEFTQHLISTTTSSPTP